MTMAKSGRLTGKYYSNAVTSGGESEASAISGRDDMEITASEYSSIPGSKCLDPVFGIHTLALPISGISPSQRSNTVIQLKAELEQVQMFKKKFEPRRKTCPTLSDSNRNNGNRIDNCQKSSMVNSDPGKIINQQGTSGRIDAVRQVPVPSTSSLILLRQCEALLKRLMSHQFGWVFNNPVDVVKLNIPDYLTIIKHPMDLGTIKSKSSSGAYINPLEFLADVRLTFSNAMAYNPRGHDVHFMADTMSKFFETRWKPIGKKISVADSQIVQGNSGIRKEVETDKKIPPSKRRKVTPPQQPPVISEPIIERIMTEAEKHNLGRDLESLVAELPAQILNFLKDHSSNGRESVEDEIEIDIGEFSDDSLFTLRKLIDDYLQEKQKNHAKAEPCEIELLNESGLSNSSMQPYKGDEPVDEDVDIGDNEPPVSSYPPIEIEKDSDSEADEAKVLTTEATKALGLVETKAYSTGMIGVHDQVEGHQSVSGLDQVEAQFQQIPNSVESDYCQDGDSAPTEKQVSPDKLYRAALLKNRFADTILKAREKTLKQGEKADPEKRRREKEELESQRRQEKARLQAEAKAAEEARRQVEIEAAAEAKRKRDVEREAARQALLKMERTVEINENSRFLKDLEMLREAPANNPLSISNIDETASPNHADEDGLALGGFNFGSNNPLEQLGLYMKDDYEEEEGDRHNDDDDDDAPNMLEQLGLSLKKDDEEEEEDVEEGEID